MKRTITFIICILSVFIVACGKMGGSNSDRTILAIYNNPNSQILTEDGNSTNKANSMTFLYSDNSFTQYVLHDGKCDKYAEGTFDVNFDWEAVEFGEGESHVMTLHMEKTFLDGSNMQKTDLTYELDLDNMQDYCLYPENVDEGVEPVAVFMQDKKQKLEKENGTEVYLPTTWIYYDDGSFQQYVLTDNEEDILFSTGDYHFADGGFTKEGAVITIHRTQKYQDGKGLSDYDSTHDYEIGSLGFYKAYPENTK